VTALPPTAVATASCMSDALIPKARGRLAIYYEVKVGLTHIPKEPEVLNSGTVAITAVISSPFSSGFSDRLRIALPRGRLFTRLSFRLHCLRWVARNSKIHREASNLTIHGAYQFVFVLMKDGPPLILGYQVNEVLRIAKSSRVGPSSGRPACDTTVFTSGNDEKIMRA